MERQGCARRRPPGAARRPAPAFASRAHGGPARGTGPPPASGAGWPSFAWSCGARRSRRPKRPTAASSDAIAEKVNGFGGRVEELATDAHRGRIRGGARGRCAAARRAGRHRGAEAGGAGLSRAGSPVVRSAPACTSPSASWGARGHAPSSPGTATGGVGGARGRGRTAAPGDHRRQRGGRRLLERRFDSSPLRGGGRSRDLAPHRPGARGFALDGRTTAFTGRQQELVLLERRPDSALQGRGQVVAIAGEPGMGKSRLLSQLRQRSPAAPRRGCEGRCLSYASDIPYLRDRGDPAAVVRDRRRGRRWTPPTLKVRKAPSRAPALDRGGARAVPVAPAGLGGRGRAPRSDIGPEQLKVRTFDAASAVAPREPKAAPRGGDGGPPLGRQDVGRGDRPAGGNGGRGADPAHRHLPARVPRLVAGPLLRDAALPGVPSRTTTASSCCAPRWTARPCRSRRWRLLAERGEGNPFFLEELARAFGEQEERGAPPAVPETIQGVLGGRIDRLAPADRRVLQTAAVVGRDVPLAVLRGVSREPEDAAPLPRPPQGRGVPVRVARQRRWPTRSSTR